MDLELAGRTVVVTGAGRGIGLAVVRAFVREGARVVAGSLTVTDDLAAATAEGGHAALALDLTTTEGPNQLAEAAGPRVDVLVSNVGAAPARPGGFLSVSDEMWSSTWSLNLMSAVRVTRAVLPRMLADGGSVVVVGSVNARLPDPAVVDYCAAKAALVNLAKAWSKEFGPRGIRVNTVDPGPVSTPLWLGAGGVAETLGRAGGQTPEQVAAAAASQMVTGRFTTPEEVADLVLFLAGSRAGNMTGSDVTIDGGLITTL